MTPLALVLTWIYAKSKRLATAEPRPTTTCLEYTTSYHKTQEVIDLASGQAGWPGCRAEPQWLPLSKNFCWCLPFCGSRGQHLYTQALCLIAIYQRSKTRIMNISCGIDWLWSAPAQWRFQVTASPALPYLNDGACAFPTIAEGCGIVHSSNGSGFNYLMNLQGESLIQQANHSMVWCWFYGLISFIIVNNSTEKFPVQ